MTPTSVQPHPDESWAWKSWLVSANGPACGFPLQNLPFCVFVAAHGEHHLGVGIGDSILDLNALANSGLLDSLPYHAREACTAPTLNRLMGQRRSDTIALRQNLKQLLADSATPYQRNMLQQLLRPIESATFTLPVEVPNYTDFYASLHHATNVGKLFRPGQPLLPNYKHLPIGYHARASSIVISGTPIHRPQGQTKPPFADFPTFGPSQQLDYELEVAAYIATGNKLGKPIGIDVAEHHLFGISLLNDWSARDIQSWEYQPLGPFLGKSFATTVSPWVVTMDALAPFFLPAAPRSAGDPEPLPYLFSPQPAAIDLHLEVFLSTQSMRESAIPPLQLSSANLRNLYWSFPQLIAHHTSNGCNLLPGDLLASGTVSGPTDDSLGSLLEITRRGTIPLHLPNGETRTFLEGGDEIILRGLCERPNLPSISLGECRGIVLQHDRAISKPSARFTDSPAVPAPAR